MCVSGYFGSRQNIWESPIDRNAFGLLNQFGDGELTKMILPRTLMIQTYDAKPIHIPGGRGAPAVIKQPAMKQVTDERQRVGLKVNNTTPGPKQLLRQAARLNNESSNRNADKTASRISQKNLRYWEIPNQEACTACGCGCRPDPNRGLNSDHVREKDGLWAVLFWLNLLVVKCVLVVDLLVVYWCWYR